MCPKPPSGWYDNGFGWFMKSWEKWVKVPCPEGYHKPDWLGRCWKKCKSGYGDDGWGSCFPLDPNTGKVANLSYVPKTYFKDSYIPKTYFKHSFGRTAE